MYSQSIVTLFTIFIFYATLFVNIGAVNIPPYLQICERYSKDLNGCIKESINKLIPMLKNGDELLGYRQIDPYVIDIINFRYNQGAVAVSMDIKNASCYGMSQTKVRGVKSKVTDQELNLDISVFHPHITLESDYQGEGRFNDFHVNSGGYVNVTMVDVKGIWKLRGSANARNGKTFMKIKSFNVVPKIKSMKFYATGLFPDPDLTQLAVEFLNQNWKFLLEQFFPITKRAWEPIILEVANRIFDQIPYDDLLPK